MPRPSSVAVVPRALRDAVDFAAARAEAVPAACRLTANGYNAYVLKVVFDGWWREFNTWHKHDVCVYREAGGRWYAIDIFVHHYPGTRNPVRPFDSIPDLCDTMPSRYDSTTWTSYELWSPGRSLIETVKH